MTTNVIESRNLSVGYGEKVLLKNADFEVHQKDIFVIMGGSGCGKSSLLRFPALLAQTANYNGSNPPISFFGEYLDYGNFEDVVFGKSGDEISFSLCYDIDI